MPYPFLRYTLSALFKDNIAKYIFPLIFLFEMDFQGLKYLPN